jgi:nitroreductase
VYDLASAADQAQRAEGEDLAWRAELRYWTGGNRLLGSGVPDAVIPDRAARTTVPGRDFGHHGDLPVSGAHENAAAFAVLYGPDDGEVDWLRAGEALSAAWLTATELGLSVLPLSATIEVAVTRERLRSLLAGLGRPHLVLRFTTGDPALAAAPHTPRLPADQVIERF